MNVRRKEAMCGTCTLKLVAIAYRRAPWFRLVREPLKLGMRVLSRVYGINTGDYLVRTPACRNCIRFYKIALKEGPASFRWLHKWINPLFDRVIEKIVTEEERKQTKEYAQIATQGSAGKDRAEIWMRDMKTGF